MSWATVEILYKWAILFHFKWQSVKNWQNARLIRDSCIVESYFLSTLEPVLFICGKFDERIETLNFFYLVQVGARYALRASLRNRCFHGYCFGHIFTQVLKKRSNLLLTYRGERESQSPLLGALMYWAPHLKDQRSEPFSFLCWWRWWGKFWLQ